MFLDERAVAKRRSTRPSKTQESDGVFRRHGLQLAAIALAAVAVYANSVHVPFVFDDLDSITKNQVVHNLHSFLFSSAGYLYNPRRFLAYLTFALNYAADGLHVAPYHFVNIVIHVCNSLLVYCFVLATFDTPQLRDSPLRAKAKLLAFLAALMFAVHPIQTEAVTYIVQRITSLACLFFLASMLCYARYRIGGASGGVGAPKWLYGASLVLALLAFETKENTFTLPMVVVLYELVFMDGPITRRLKRTVPYFLLAGLVFLTFLNWRLPAGEIASDVGGLTRASTSLSRLSYLTTQFCVVVTYIGFVLFPFGRQNIDHDYRIYTSIANPRVMLSIALLLCLLGAAILALRVARKPARSHWRLVGFGVIWFFVTLSIESSVFPIADVMVEHRIYLPLIGAVMAFVALWGVLFQASTSQTKKGAAVLIPLLVLPSLAVATVQRNLVWQSPLTLWADSVRKSPNKARPYHHLGLAFSEEGRDVEAIRLYGKAISLFPGYAQAYNDLGISLSKIGRMDEAVPYFEKAFALKPNFSQPYYNLGRIYLMNKSQFGEAANLFKKSIDLQPDFYPAYVNLAAALNQLGEYRESMQVLRGKVPPANQTSAFHYNLGRSYYCLGQSEGFQQEVALLDRLNPALAARLRHTVCEPANENR